MLQEKLFKPYIDRLIASKHVEVEYRAEFNDELMHYLLKQDLGDVKQILINNKLTEIAFYVQIKPNFCSLIKLELKNNTLRNVGCRHLSKIQLPILQWLSLASNEIDDHGMSHLAKMQATRIKMFSLYGNKLTVKGVQNFNKINCQRLAYLSLDYIQKLHAEQLLKIILFQSNQIVKIHMLPPREVLNLLEKRFVKLKK